MPKNASTDREHWNVRYGDQPWSLEPSPWLVANEELLPEAGRALDVAGGTGRNAMRLAKLGWDVTIADVSDVALAQARERAGEEHLEIETLRVDLARDSLPDGLWILIALFHYLDRDVLPTVACALAPGGILIGALATVRNLERNPRPPRPYLLEERELPGLLTGLEMVAYDEGWQDDHHDARF
ncbi:MAG: class I SAM-dependent methyltransferase, partial [Actinomycetia bacterium]|nr:class I SAM-dependent methyltransferase [Actinomycetes bacterium]